MKYIFELCAGRHSTPATDAIFPAEVDPTNFNALYRTACRAIPQDATSIDLYVTGLSQALLSAVAVCIDRGISLTAFHFDRTTGEYLPQRVLHFGRCVYCGADKVPREHTCPNCGAS